MKLQINLCFLLFRVRFHYGHPDIFDRIFHLTRGGISKASKTINLSEDIFSGKHLYIKLVLVYWCYQMVNMYKFLQDIIQLYGEVM